MARKRYTAEQIIGYLRSAEVMIGQGKTMDTGPYTLRQRIGIYGEIDPAVVGKGGREDALHRTRQPVGEWIQRKL